MILAKLGEHQEVVDKTAANTSNSAEAVEEELCFETKHWFPTGQNLWPLPIIVMNNMYIFYLFMYIIIESMHSAPALDSVVICEHCSQ